MLPMYRLANHGTRRHIRSLQNRAEWAWRGARVCRRAGWLSGRCGSCWCDFGGDVQQLDLGAPPLLIVGNERRFPGIAQCAIDFLRDGFDVTLHHWVDQSPREFTLSASMPGLTLERRGLRVRQGSRGLTIRWADAFAVEADGRQYFNLHRLYDLPVRVAKKLIADADGYDPDRDSARLVDALRRAMERAPWGFSRAFYAPTMGEVMDSRAARSAPMRAALDAEDASDTPAAPLPIAPGDVFRFTASFLRSAYGVDIWGACGAPDERWIAVACECGLCASGRFVAIDTGRHFARGNVERCPFSVGRSRRGSEAESDAFLAAEREQLGVDRVAGTVRP